MEERYLRLYHAGVVDKQGEKRIYPRGGILFRFDREPNPQDVASVLMNIRSMYGGFLGSMGNFLVRNPIDWINYFRMPNFNPELQPAEERADGARRFSQVLGLFRRAQNFLVALAKQIETSSDSCRKLFRKQAYSLAGFVDENGKHCIAFAPRLKRPLGVLDLMGISVNRIRAEGASDKERRARAKQLARVLEDNSRTVWQQLMSR